MWEAEREESTKGHFIVANFEDRFDRNVINRKY